MYIKKPNLKDGKRGNLKITKKGWTYGAGAGLHACVCVCVGEGGGRGGEWLQLTLFSFSSRFISFSLEITLPFEKLCYAFKKKFFFATIIFCKKVTLIYLKMNLQISHKLRFPICDWFYNIKS